MSQDFLTRVPIKLAGALALVFFAQQASGQSNQGAQQQWNCQAINGEWACDLEDSPRPAYQLPANNNFSSQTNNAAIARRVARDNLDWVPRAELTPEQQADCPRGCQGAYVQPERAQEDADLDPRVAELRGEARSSQIDARAREATLDGDVVFTQGWRQVTADRVVVNQEKSSYALDGNVTIREPGLLVVGDSASVSGEDNSLNVVNATYLLHEQRLRGSASEMRRDGEERFVIEGATYTSCEPGDEGWLMTTSELSINEETGRVVGRNVVVETAGIPVFYTPYISFPIDDRPQTGILYPSIKLGSEDGLDYEQPYYWNIQPNQDATFYPRLIENRGVALGAEHRYLSESTYTQSAATYTPEDTSGDRGGLYSDDARWLLNLNHQGYVLGFWTQWNIARVSDIDYFEDYGVSIVDEASTSNLEQFGAIGYQDDNWNLSLVAETFQSLVVGASNQYRRLPELDVEGQGQWLSNLWWQMDYQLSRFDHSSDDVANATGFQQSTDGTWVTGTRLRTEFISGWRTESDWYHFEPALGVDYLYYNLDNPLANQTIRNPSEFAPSVSLDAGFAFERQANLFGTDFIQTLEPEFFYLNRDAGDQNDMPVFDTTEATRSYDLLFRRNRFVGGDRISDTHQVTLGLSSSLYDQSGEEVGRLRVAQARYLEDRQVHLSPEILAGLIAPGALPSDSELLEAAARGRETLNELGYGRSELIATLDLGFSANWSLGSEVIWDGIASTIDRTQLQVSYQHPERHQQIDISYFREKDVAYLRDRNGDGFSTFDELLLENVEQVGIAASTDWGEKWALTALWQFDISNSRSIDSGLGVSYQNCCWNVSATWRRWLERDDSTAVFTEDVRHDTGIFLGFEWVGLGGIGQSPSEILQRQRIQ